MAELTVFFSLNYISSIIDFNVVVSVLSLLSHQGMNQLAIAVKKISNFRGQKQ